MNERKNFSFFARWVFGSMVAINLALWLQMPYEVLLIFGFTLCLSVLGIVLPVIWGCMDIYHEDQEKKQKTYVEYFFAEDN